MMVVLVVTGGIGSGKSEVCRILEQIGLDCQYNADMKVKALYTGCSGLLESIEKGLGCSLRDEDGCFIPSRLAERIFSDKEALAFVESLVFPALIEDFEEHCRKNAGKEVVIFESATILEKPQFDGFGDITVLVDAPFDIRLERACRRDGADKDAVLARMSNQKLMNALSDGMSDPRIDAVIVNDGTFEELKNRTIEVVSGLLKDKDLNKNILTD